MINPTKSNIGKKNKIVLENINGNIKEQLKVNQWRNTNDVLKWFTALPDKKSLTFICFDIVEFYPSITQELLGKALKFASNYCNITADDEHIIMSTKKSVLVNNSDIWCKKNGTFDVAMGSYDGAETCEL